MLLLSVLMPVFAAPVVSVTAAVAAVITVAVSDTYKCNRDCNR